MTGPDAWLDGKVRTRAREETEQTLTKVPNSVCGRLNLYSADPYAVTAVTAVVTSSSASFFPAASGAGCTNASAAAVRTR